MYIHHLIFINEHGEIKIVKPSKGAKNPEHLSVDPISGYTVIHHLEAIDNMGSFVDTKIWDSDTSQWTTRTARPNEFAAWENGSWTWDPNALLDKIRELRLNRLLESDWTIFPDSPLTDAQQTEARTYRTSLRDLPASLDMTTISSIDDVIWPTKPEFL
jgi:hypothetical protein